MTRLKTKLAEATSVPFPDSGVTQAATSPVPSLSVGNKPAPGLKGPKGLAPRTNYSRVNTGAVPTLDVGASSVKSVAPDAQSFLPPKIASENPMGTNMTPRMTLQDMIKAAAAGAANHVAISLEAAHQLSRSPEAPVAKTAAAALPGGLESVPTSYVDKLASAVEFIVKESEAGEGPNALGVLEATSSNNEIAPGQLGKAVEQTIPPMDPPLAKRDGASGDPGNALKDNADMSHPAQPVDPMGNDRSIKAAAALGGVAAAKGGQEKKAANRLAELLAGFKKQAEDAINPAQISAGTIDTSKPPEGARQSGESGPAEPSDVSSQKRLISSNDAAINYTKREAKADPKSDASRVLVNPALSAAHDSTLQKAYDNAEKAGVKISHSVKAAGIRALLEKMAEEADKSAKKTDKKKESMGASGSFTAPPVGGAAGAV